MKLASPKTLIENDYGAYLRQNSGKQLLQIFSSVDKTEFPERYDLIREELCRRGYDINDLSIRGIWAKVAADLGAVFQGHGFGTVKLRWEAWEIILAADSKRAFPESHSEEKDIFTRMQARYINMSGFYFRIYQKSLFNFMSSSLGPASLTIGEGVLDGDFVMQSNDERIITQILWDSSIKSILPLLLKEEEPLFQILPGDDDSSYQLCFECRGLVSDIELLAKLFVLFEHTLQQLYYLGCAAKKLPYAT